MTWVGDEYQASVDGFGVFCIYGIAGGYDTYEFVQAGNEALGGGIEGGSWGVELAVEMGAGYGNVENEGSMNTLG